MVRAEDLVLGYGARTVLEGVSFDVAAGEILVVAGASGSGKSTILKNMIGLARPMRGRVLVDGIDVARARDADRRRLFRTIGVSYQADALFGSRTALENVSLPLEELTHLPPAAIETIALTKLRLVGLVEAAALLPSEASGGMRKRIAIARALALDPKVVFLDEPSGNLDPITMADVDDLILDLRSLLGVTFVIVSHELSSIFAIADRVLFLDPKKRTAAALDTPERLRASSDPAVREFFAHERRRPRAAKEAA